MEIYQHIRNFLQEISSPIIFELGVHWGEDTPRLIMWGGKGTIYHGFEADKRNYQKAKLVIYQNHYGKLTLGAISDKTGEAVLYLSDGTHTRSGNQMTGASSIRKPKVVKTRHRWIKFDKTQRVKTHTIDNYCAENKINKIDFIWSDIQGCEYDMIIGAKDMLPHVGMMLLEYSDVELYEGQKNSKEILKLLGKDWELIAKGTMDLLVKNKKYENNS